MAYGLAFSPLRPVRLGPREGACLHGSPSWHPGYTELKSPSTPQNGTRNQALSFSVKKMALKSVYITAGPAEAKTCLPPLPPPTPTPIEKSQKGSD